MGQLVQKLGRDVVPLRFISPPVWRASRRYRNHFTHVGLTLYHTQGHWVRQDLRQASSYSKLCSLHCIRICYCLGMKPHKGLISDHSVDVDVVEPQI